MTDFPDSRLVLVGDRVASMCDRLAPSAEEMLIEKEELELQGLTEEPELARKLPLSSPQIHAALERLPPKEAEALIAYFAGGQHQREMAVRMGISQPAMHYRIHRAIRLLRWVTGPGALFTPEDIERDLRGVLPADHVHALAIYWRTTCVRSVAIAMGIHSHSVAWRMIRRAIERLHGRYKRGFDALVTSGKCLLEHVPVRFSAVEDFIRRRCAFAPSARVARASIVASYERHARSVMGPASSSALTRALEARGVRSRTIRVPWAKSPVRGFVGVRLQPSLTNVEKVALSAG